MVCTRHCALLLGDTEVKKNTVPTFNSYAYLIENKVSVYPIPKNVRNTIK